MIEETARGEIYRYTVKCSPERHVRLKSAARAAGTGEGEVVQAFFDRFLDLACDFGALTKEGLARMTTPAAGEASAMRPASPRARANEAEMAARCERVHGHFAGMAKDASGMTRVNVRHACAALGINSSIMEGAIRHLIAQRRLYRIVGGGSGKTGTLFKVIAP